MNNMNKFLLVAICKLYIKLSTVELSTYSLEIIRKLFLRHRRFKHGKKVLIKLKKNINDIL